MHQMKQSIFRRKILAKQTKLFSNNFSLSFNNNLKTIQEFSNYSSNSDNFINKIKNTSKLTLMNDEFSMLE